MAKKKVIVKLLPYTTIEENEPAIVAKERKILMYICEATGLI